MVVLLVWLCLNFLYIPDYLKIMIISCIVISVTSFYAHLKMWRPQTAGGKYSQ